MAAIGMGAALRMEAQGHLEDRGQRLATVAGLGMFGVDPGV